MEHSIKIKQTPCRYTIPALLISAATLATCLYTPRTFLSVETAVAGLAALAYMGGMLKLLYYTANSEPATAVAFMRFFALVAVAACVPLWCYRLWPDESLQGYCIAASFGIAAIGLVAGLILKQAPAIVFLVWLLYHPVICLLAIVVMAITSEYR